MPIYEYQCDACQHHLEAIQKLSDAPLETCPSCGKAALRKLVSAAAFQLKGTGWYATDFRDKGKQESANGSNANEAPAKSAQGDTSSTKTGTGEGGG